MVEVIVDEPNIPALTAEEMEKNVTDYFESEVQNFLDNKAKERGYDDIRSASLRAALPNSPFYQEGIAYGAWMDNVWAYCYGVLADVKAGIIPQPTVEELIIKINTDVVLVLP